MKLKRAFPVVLGLLYSMLAACAGQPVVPGTTAPQALPTQTIAAQTGVPLPTDTITPTTASNTAAPATAAPTLAATSTFTPDPAALCPRPGKDSSLYLSDENGFCFLVPAGFEIQKELQRPGEVVTLLGPAEPLGPKQQEAIRVMLTVETNGSAEGMDSAAYASEWQKRFTTPDDPVEASDLTVGGQPATLLSNLPGFARMQAVFVIANGVRYRISLIPQPGEVPELDEAASAGMETLLNSMVFFPPQKEFTPVKAEDVCPHEGQGARLVKDELEGYCFLYPSEFEPSPDFPGAVVAPQVVGQWEGGDVQPSVTVGFYTPPNGLTPLQILEQRMEFVQPGSVAETAIGGYPAVTFIDVNGAWPSRQAIVVVDPSRAYSVLAQPLDEARFPAAPAYVDKAWDMVTGSLRFFDRWR